MIQWACCDLNASRWLPKPQGYQATPQAQDGYLQSKKKKQIKEFSVESIRLEVFEVLSEFLVFLRQNVYGFLQRCFRTHRPIGLKAEQ